MKQTEPQSGFMLPLPKITPFLCARRRLLKDPVPPLPLFSMVYMYIYIKVLKSRESPARDCHHGTYDLSCLALCQAVDLLEEVLQVVGVNAGSNALTMLALVWSFHHPIRTVA